MKISVIGTGAYSLAIALELAKKKNKIMMWTENPKIAEEFNQTHKLNSIFDIEIPKNISVTTDMEKVLEDSELIYIITASRYVDSVCDKMVPYYHKLVPICIASKGIEESSEELLSNIVEQNCELNIFL